MGTVSKVASRLDIITIWNNRFETAFFFFEVMAAEARFWHREEKLGNELSEYGSLSRFQGGYQ